MILPCSVIGGMLHWEHDDLSLSADVVGPKGASAGSCWLTAFFPLKGGPSNASSCLQHQLCRFSNVALLKCFSSVRSSSFWPIPYLSIKHSQQIHLPTGPFLPQILLKKIFSVSLLTKFSPDSLTWFSSLTQDWPQPTILFLSNFVSSLVNPCGAYLQSL